jgi:enoyl-CoA hydratase/carnithine racemase
VTLELALTGEPIDAARALHHGLVNRVVPASEVLAVAIGIATTIAANAPMAVLLAKEIALDARGLLDPDIAAWRERAAGVFASDDAQEGARAFAEKRPPNFTGH